MNGKPLSVSSVAPPNDFISHRIGGIRPAEMSRNRSSRRWTPKEVAATSRIVVDGQWIFGSIDRISSRILWLAVMDPGPGHHRICVCAVVDYKTFNRHLKMGSTLDRELW